MPIIIKSSYLIIPRLDIFVACVQVTHVHSRSRSRPIPPLLLLLRLRLLSSSSSYNHHHLPIDARVIILMMITVIIVVSSLPRSDASRFTLTLGGGGGGGKNDRKSTISRRCLCFIVAIYLLFYWSVERPLNRIEWRKLRNWPPGGEIHQVPTCQIAKIEFLKKELC